MDGRRLLEGVRRYPTVPRDEKLIGFPKQKSPCYAAPSEWTEHVDLETGAYWYWNSKTGESTWEAPVEWGAVEDEYGRNEIQYDSVNVNIGVNDQATETTSPVTKQANVTSIVTQVSPPQGPQHPNDERTNWEEVKMTSPVHRQRGELTQHFDNRYNAYWYEHFDEKTGAVTCTWDMPKDWVSSAELSNSEAKRVCT